MESFIYLVIYHNFLEKVNSEEEEDEAAKMNCIESKELARIVWEIMGEDMKSTRYV